MVEVVVSLIKNNDKIYKIEVDNDDCYSEGDGTIMITVDWQKIALDAIERLVDLRHRSIEVEQVRERTPTPPIREDTFKYNEPCVCEKKPNNDYPCLCDIHSDEITSNE